MRYETLDPVFGQNRIHIIDLLPKFRFARGAGGGLSGLLPERVIPSSLGTALRNLTGDAGHNHLKVFVGVLLRLWVRVGLVVDGGTVICLEHGRDLHQ